MKAAAVLLILAYLFTLAMSSAHLASWYSTSLGGLPPWLAWGLAGALEATAFLLSLVSTYLLRGSRWAAGGAFAALGLVWTGNAISMHRAAPHLALWETLAMSAFVPIGTFVVGKVVGELLGRATPTLEPDLGQKKVQVEPPGTPSGTTPDLDDDDRERQLLAALALGPASLGQLASVLSWPKSSTHRWLQRLERQGLVRRGPNGWEVVR